MMRPRIYSQGAIELIKSCGIKDPPVDLIIMTQKLGLVYERVIIFLDSLILPMEDRIVAAVNLNNRECEGVSYRSTNRS